ncbi:MAG: STM4014 family protein, partial [Pseudomonadota bacterium]
SGVLAYEYNRRNGREHAYSTVEAVQVKGEHHYYNSLKIKKYTARTSIKAILDFLFREGALVEHWIPKAKYEACSYDLRVMGIAGRRCHAIARLSRSPMTNLHLGNSRCAVDALDLPAQTWTKIDTLVEQCMARFPRSLYAGLDILLARDGRDPVVLEANAFGDLLPNLLHNGKGTYLTEIEAILA